MRTTSHRHRRTRRAGTSLAAAVCAFGWTSGTPRAGEIDTLLFGSLDAGAASFVTVGAKVAFDRLDRDGFAALASLGAGSRSERVPCGCLAGTSATLTRLTGIGAALVGYQWFYDWGVAALFAGPEAAIEALTDGAGVLPLPARFGLRLHGEVWARPSEETLVQATLIAGSAREDAWARLAWGYRLWGAYLGPEASLYMDRTGYRKWNLGLHATDFALGRYSLRVSAGLQTETSERRSSPYVALAVWTPL